MFTAQEAVGAGSSSPNLSLANRFQQEISLDSIASNDRLRMKTVLDHFARKTVPTISPGKTAQAAWLAALPSLVAQYPFVLNGILAVGCLHLSTTAGSESERGMYQNLAADQMNIGMPQYHCEVREVTTVKAEALFAFSVMVTTFVLFTTAVDCKDTLRAFDSGSRSVEQKLTTTATMSRSICRILRSMRGVLVILVPCYHHIRDGTLQPILERDWWPAPLVEGPSEIVVDKKLRSLEMMWAQPGKTYEYSFDAFRSALKDLRENFAVVARLRDCRFPGGTWYLAVLRSITNDTINTQMVQRIRLSIGPRLCTGPSSYRSTSFLCSSNSAWKHGYSWHTMPCCPPKQQTIHGSTVSRSTPSLQQR